MQTEMNIEKRRLSDLKPAEYNPRIELKPGDPEYESIRKSIETFGYVDPIIINADGTIMGGHQRYNVLRDLGYTEAQVVVCDLSKDEERALNIALNKIAGEWDEGKLKDLIGEIQTSSLDLLSATGFSEDELNKMIGSVNTDSLNEGSEIDLDDFSDEQFECTCPKCGFRFNREGS